MIEASKRCKPWREHVKDAAIKALPDGWYAMMDKPISVLVTFIFARPNDQFINNKPGPDRLKPDAPQHCTKRIGDIDKLSRAVLDSCTSVCFEDDAQVIILNAQKRYATRNEQPSAIITIAAIS